jgi:penicillin-binding protein A
LTIQPRLQEAVQKILNSQRNIAGAVVLLESSSGRVLAMAEREGVKGNPLNSFNGEPIVTSARAPAASLMKIVTATAAMEKTGMNPDHEISFFGGCGHLRRNNWLRDSRQDRQKLTLARAFGLSCNTVFARLAMYTTGLGTLRKYIENYQFNKPIPSDFRIETSAALLPQAAAATALEVGEAGAGFGSTRLSPIQAAMMASVAGNDGKLMAPFLVDAAFNSQNERVYVGVPLVLAQVASKEVSKKLQILMQDTILTGTSRKYFKRKGTRSDRYEIGGKTGTLSDPENRSTLYTWFAGIAPLEAIDNVSLGVLVASPKTWVVRASEIAQLSFSQYLRLYRMNGGVRTEESLSIKNGPHKMGER